MIEWLPFKTDNYDNVVEEVGSKESTAMIKVPFAMDGDHGTSRFYDAAYKTMPWFKYLADHAIKIHMLEKYVSAATYQTSYVVGFELEGKHATFYRMKYSD